MKKYVHVLAAVIGPQYLVLLGIFLRFVLLSILEAIGVSLVLPVISSLGMGDGPAGNIRFAAKYFAWLGMAGPIGMMALLITVFYLKAIFGYWLQRKTFQFGYDNQKRLTVAMVLRYEQMPVSESIKIETAEMVQNLIGNIELVCVATIVASIRLLAELFVILAIALVLVSMQPVISLITVVMIFSILGVYDIFVRRRLHVSGVDAAYHRMRVIKGFQDVMKGLREIRVIGGLDFFNRQIFQSADSVKEAAVEYKSMNAIPPYLVESMAVTGFAAVFLVSEWLKLGRVEIIGLVAMFAVAAIRLIPGTNQIVASIVQMRNSYYALEKVYEGIFARPPSPQNDRLGRIPEKNFRDTPGAPRRIEFRNVTFGYPERSEPVLSDASLIIEQGSIVCFKGESGSGKSTTLDLLLGFLQPEHGQILADAVDIREYGEAWRSLFVFVPQAPFVFSGTIRENITLQGSESANDLSRLEHAIATSCLKEFIDAMPGGIDGRIEERGENLSGGQRQRIALARAFYLDRPIYLLDEPTSALDRETADRLLENLVLMRGDKTIVISSHDPNVQARCEGVFEFAGRRITSRAIASTDRYVRAPAK